ncbi:hypothetical protein ABPG72_002492 [Tetrahymena utriculariae]
MRQLTYFSSTLFAQCTAFILSVELNWGARKYFKRQNLLRPQESSKIKKEEIGFQHSKQAPLSENQKETAQCDIDNQIQMGDSEEYTRCSRNSNQTISIMDDSSEPNTTILRPRGPNSSTQKSISIKQNYEEDIYDDGISMDSLYNSFLNLKYQQSNQQRARRVLEKGDKYIQSKIEEEEENIPDYPDKLFAEKYDYKKYLQSIKNKNDSEIVKTIRKKHLKNKVIQKEDRIIKKESTPKILKEKKLTFETVKNKDNEYVIKQEIFCYYTEYLEQNKAQLVSKDQFINKMAINENILFKKRIKNTKQLLQNLIFITRVEEIILYGQRQEIQNFLNQLKDYDTSAISSQRVSLEEYKKIFENFFNIVNDFIVNIEKNIHSKESDVLNVNLFEYKSLNSYENYVLNLNLLEQSVLQSCLFNKKDIQSLIDNFILKNDNQFNHLDKAFRQLNNIDNLLTHSVNVRKNMQILNTILKILDMKMSITHDSENWHFDLNIKGKTQIRILIEKSMDNEEEVYILYDNRLQKRLTTQLPKQELPILNQATVQNEDSFFQNQQNQNTNTQMTHQKGQKRSNMQQSQKQQQLQQIQENLSQSSSQASIIEQTSQQPPQTIKLYNPNNIFKTNCCQKNMEVSKLLQLDKCKHYLCKDCLIDPLKSSANTCLSKNCKTKISDNELLRMFDTLEQVINIRCCICNSNEFLGTEKYLITCKPPPSSNFNQTICKYCKNKKDIESQKNKCPICKNCDLTPVERSKYLQCKNCKFLKCKICNLVIDRQQKSQEYCKCRCLSCLEIKKNESQDKQESNHLFCQECDETCCICRVQRRRQNAYRCKHCKFFACIPCILKITCIKTSNSKQIEKCSHFMQHYQLMEKSQLPKIEILFDKEILERQKN